MNSTSGSGGHSPTDERSLLISTFGAALLTFLSLLAAGMGLLAKYLWSQYKKRRESINLKVNASPEASVATAVSQTQNEMQHIVINITNAHPAALNDSSSSSSSTTSLSVPIGENERKHIVSLWDSVRAKIAEGKLKPVAKERKSPRPDGLTPDERRLARSLDSRPVGFPDAPRSDRKALSDVDISASNAYSSLRFGVPVLVPGSGE